LCIGRFTPMERTPGTHWSEGWVGLIAGLEAAEKTKSLVPDWTRIPILRPSSTYPIAILTESYLASKVKENIN
jgi:hypothetical protein